MDHHEFVTDTYLHLTDPDDTHNLISGDEAIPRNVEPNESHGISALQISYLSGHTVSPVSELSVASSFSSISDADYFSPSVAFHDLHDVDQKLEIIPVFAAIEQAFEKRRVSYNQATDLRNMISHLVDTYGKFYRTQKNIQDLVTGQVRYYQETFEALNDAETLPWRMKQQLQGLRGDAQRLNDELSKSKGHLSQLEREIVQLENDKSHKLETLESIPVQADFRYLEIFSHLEQQVVQQQLDGYKAIIGRTSKNIEENSGSILRLEGRYTAVLEDLSEKRKELVAATHVIPHLQKECATVSIDQMKMSEELHALLGSNTSISHTLQTLENSIKEAEKENTALWEEKTSSRAILDEKSAVYKHMIQQFEKVNEEIELLKEDKAALETELSHARSVLREKTSYRLGLLRDRDNMVVYHRKMELENDRHKLVNETNRENYDRIRKQADEKDEVMALFRREIMQIERLIDAYGIDSQSQRDQNHALQRQKKERHKTLFIGVAEFRRMAHVTRALKTGQDRLEREQKLQNANHDKFHKRLTYLNEDCEHKEVVIRYTTSVVDEKQRKNESMQKEYYRLDRERQELQEDYRISEGHVHENKDRVAFLEDEIHHVQQNFKNSCKILEQLESDRKSISLSLTQLRNLHLKERQRLKHLSETYERGFSRVLILRRDLDINLLKCETFTDTFDLVSELRACEAALFIDITTQYMLKFVEKNQIETAIYQTELQHRALDSYVTWLHKTSDTDIKLLYKRLHWRGELLQKYRTTKEELEKQLIVTITRRRELTDKATQARDMYLSEQLACPCSEINGTKLRQKEHMLVNMLIAMEQRLFSQRVHFSLLDGICKELNGQAHLCRRKAAVYQEIALVGRLKWNRTNRKEKLALIDVAAAKTNLCNELVLAENLQEAQKLTMEKYCSMAEELQAGDHGNKLPITYGQT